MNTPAHAVLGLVALERRFETAAAPWIIAGSVVPDLPNVVLFAVYGGVLGMPATQVYGEVYPRAAWQAVLAPSHSLLVVAVLAALGAWRRWPAVLAFAAAMGVHLVPDALTHARDAHPHLWPLSSWRWQSPVSYWDRAHHAGLFVPIELALVVLAAGWSWRRAGDRPRWRRPFLVVCGAWLAIAWATGLAFWGT